MSEDYLDRALQKIERETAARRAAADREAEQAMTPHPSDPELDSLLGRFAGMMPKGSAIPFDEQIVIQDPPQRRFRTTTIPPPRQESITRAHGWVLWGLGGRDVYWSRPPNAGAMGRLALGVTINAEPMFVLRFLPSRQLPPRPIESVRIGRFDFYEHDLSDSPLCARTLGPLTVENKCGAILETLRLRFTGNSVSSTDVPTPVDQAEQLLITMGEVMAQMLFALQDHPLVG